MRRDGYLTASILTRADCAEIVRKVEMKPKKSKATKKPKKVRWIKGGNFGMESLIYADAIPFIDGEVMARVVKTLSDIGLRIERSPRFSLTASGR